MDKDPGCEKLKEKVNECIKSDETFPFPSYYYKWKLMGRSSGDQPMIGDDEDGEKKVESE